LFHAHKQREVFDVALKILDFGHRLEDSGGDTMHYLLGASIRSLALQRIRQMTPRTDLPEAELVRVIRTLDKFGANERGLSNALKVQYQLESKLLDDFAAGRWEALEITNSPSERVTLSNEMKRVFNADKTRAKFAATIRLLLKNISEPFCNVAWPEYSKTKTVGLAWLQWAVQGKHNAQGDVWLAMNIPSLKKFFERKSRENVDVRGTQLLLALKIFVARRGHLPASLTELTPEFFPKVPLDDFDGQPFRYLAWRKAHLFSRS
jgi:hypothetical protein